MKKITFIFLTSIIAVSCSNSTNDTMNNSINSDSPASNYVEYVWHSAEENFNAENLAMLIEKWNQIIDSYSCDMDGANILTPTEKRDNYDFIWVLKWPSVDARNSCWDTWSKDYAESWDQIINGIMSYDPNNAFMFEVEPGRSPKKENTSGSFVNTFYFCKFNDGNDMSSLNAYRNDLAKVSTFSDNHWYVLLNPTFETDPGGPDFVWLDLWGSNQDKNSDMEIWQSTDLPDKAESMVACDEFSNNAVVIR